MNFSSLTRLPAKNQFYVGIITTCVTAFICFLFFKYINKEIVAFVLLLQLSLIAMIFDIVPVLACALLSALIWGFIFMPPVLSFELEKSEDVFTLCMYFLISIVSATLTYKIRQMEKIIQEEEKKAQAVKLYNTILNSLSHEFRTPIAAIIASTDNLLYENIYMSEDARKVFIEEISIAALRLNRHVENLLNMSRIESGFVELKKEWCDIEELINNVLSELEEQKKDHLVFIDVDDDLPLCKLDYALMEQVFVNLFNNAFQYTQSSSAITIKASYSNEFLVILFSDNGKGFPPEEIGKVFNKFYRVNNLVPGGTGLGLSIIKGFVEAHKGNIILKNKTGGGAEFLIRIPVEINNIQQKENEKNTYTYN